MPTYRGSPINAFKQKSKYSCWTGATLFYILQKINTDVEQVPCYFTFCPEINTDAKHLPCYFIFYSIINIDVE